MRVAMRRLRTAMRHLRRRLSEKALRRHIASGDAPRRAAPRRGARRRRAPRGSARGPGRRHRSGSADGIAYAIDSPRGAAPPLARRVRDRILAVRPRRSFRDAARWLRRAVRRFARRLIERGCARCWPARNPRSRAGDFDELHATRIAGKALALRSRVLRERPRRIVEGSARTARARSGPPRIDRRRRRLRPLLRRSRRITCRPETHAATGIRARARGRAARARRGASIRCARSGKARTRRPIRRAWPPSISSALGSLSPKDES